MIGRIVRSLKGRDSGKFMVVVGTKDDRLLVCDGKERRLEKPKPKNISHLTITNSYLSKEQFTSNRTLRRELYRYSVAAAKNEEEK